MRPERQSEGPEAAPDAPRGLPGRRPVSRRSRARWLPASQEWTHSHLQVPHEGLPPGVLSPGGRGALSPRAPGPPSAGLPGGSPCRRQGRPERSQEPSLVPPHYSQSWSPCRAHCPPGPGGSPEGRPAPLCGWAARPVTWSFLWQMSWASLRAAFPALSPAQLHRLLTQYQLASAMGPMSAWEPGAQDGAAAFKSGEPVRGAASWGLVCGLLDAPSPGGGRAGPPRRKAAWGRGSPWPPRSGLGHRVLLPLGALRSARPPGRGRLSTLGGSTRHGPEHTRRVHTLVHMGTDLHTCTCSL